MQNDPKVYSSESASLLTKITKNL